MEECKGDKCRDCEYCQKHNKLFFDISSMKWRKALVFLNITEFILLVVIGVCSICGDNKLQMMIKSIHSFM